MKHRIRRRRARGFSLLEVLVVLGIIALISGVVAVALVKHFNDARIKTTRLSATTIRNAAQTWRMQKGSECPDMATLVADDAIDQASSTKDAWDQPFIITCDDKGHLRVASAGPDKKVDTEDDIHVP